jgi:hypothetical protein
MANRFLIAPFNSGLQCNLPVWQTPEDSFYTLENAYIHRGVIKKRFGSMYIGTGATTEQTAQLKSRFRIHVDTTDENGDATGVVPGAVFRTGQIFSIGSEIYTVVTGGYEQDMLVSGGAATVYNYSTVAGVNPAGTYNFEDATALTNVYWYPADPVMGLTLWEKGDIHNRTAIGFDPQFIYQFSGIAWTRSGTTVFRGDNTNYFWATNFEGEDPDETALFVTNYNADEANTDLMYYTQDITTWNAFTPIVVPNGGIGRVEVATAKIIAPFKSSLLLFGTYERTVAGLGPPITYTYKTFKNRIRWCTPGKPLDTDYAWLPGTEDGYTGGGFLDAPVEEEIVSIGYVQDRLIVYFERSTYELVFTFNESYPFILQRISSDLGSASQFSSVQSENGVLTIGDTGIHICNGVRVSRIDQKIPDQISTYLKENTAVKRICGIKNFDREVFYWSIPAQRAADTEKYPDKILTYNYENDSFAIFDDCITAFGYLEQKISDTWEEDYQMWEDDDSTWEDADELAGYLKVIAGNQHGFVFALTDNDNTNAPVLQVTNIVGTTLTVYDHNLQVGDYIQLHNCGDADYDLIYRVDSVPTDDTCTVVGIVVAGYRGGATISRVSKINIVSTAWNPYNNKGRNVSLSKIIFGVKKTVNGEISVNYYPSQARADFITAAQATGAAIGTNVLETGPYDLIPLEASQDLLWHSVYLQAEGNTVQIQLTWNDTQIRNKSIVSSDFEIQGIILETSPTGGMG